MNECFAVLLFMSSTAKRPFGRYGITGAVEAFLWAEVILGRCHRTLQAFLPQ